MTNLN